MIHRFSSAFAEDLCSHGIIKSEDKDVYIYGGTAIMKNALNLIIPLIVALTCSIFIEMTAFIASYSSIRCYAGGYHAKTELRCFVISQCTVLGFAYLIRTGSWIPVFALLPVGALSFLVIVLLAPVEADNNPLTCTERRVYRKQSIVLSSCFFVAFFAFTLFYKPIGIAIGCALINTAVHLVVGHAIHMHWVTYTNDV